MKKHLAILRQPFLDLILKSEKTIETRWSKNKIIPFNAVSTGDVLFMKEVGKDVTATAAVDKVLFFELTPRVADEIKEKYGREICIDRFENWEEVRLKRYATLMWLRDVKAVTPTRVAKSCRAGWMLLDDLFVTK